MTESRIEKGAAPYQNVLVIINPASGQDRPILGTMNKAFSEAGINWDVRLTKQAGDGLRFAQEAVASGIDAVGVYGGDGTVMEVANGLQGTGVPLAIFPGGTANVMSIELGIPNDLAQAMALVCSDGSFVRKIDMGRCGDRYFMLRIGIGFEADMINNAPREAKERMGKLAYILSAFQTLQKQTMAHYELVLDDGDPIELDGITCMVANSGNIGLPGVTMAKLIDVSDGLLDVLLVRDANIGTLVNVAASAVGAAEPLAHYQARSVKIVTDPPQAAICDGESIGDTPLSAEIVPQALSVIVPRAAVSSQQAAQAESQG